MAKIIDRLNKLYENVKNYINSQEIDEENKMTISLVSAVSIDGNNAYISIYPESDKIFIKNGEHQTFLGRDLEFTYGVYDDSKKKIGEGMIDVSKKLLSFDSNQISDEKKSFKLNIRDKKNNYEALLKIAVVPSVVERNKIINRKVMRIQDTITANKKSDCRTFLRYCTCGCL